MNIILDSNKAYGSDIRMAQYTNDKIQFANQYRCFMIV